MSQFEFKEDDAFGLETLDVISKADKFNKWMYDTIKPFCKGDILEIGSGTGNISSFFLNDGYSIFLSDIRESYCENLSKKFDGIQNLKDVSQIDLTDIDFDRKHQKLLGTFDTVFALNVVEHIYDDKKAIDNCKKLLKDEGHLIILVPAYQSLYNGFDKFLEHYRRYTKNTLAPLLTEAGFQVIKKKYFNFIGIFGWFVSGKLQKNETIPEGQMGLYNLLVPIFKIADLITFNKVGLSVICVGKK